MSSLQMDASPIHSSAATSPLPLCQMGGAMEQSPVNDDHAPKSGSSADTPNDPDTGMTSDGDTADFVEMDNDLAYVSA